MQLLGDRKRNPDPLLKATFIDGESDFRYFYLLLFPGVLLIEMSMGMLVGLSGFWENL